MRLRTRLSLVAASLLLAGKATAASPDIPAAYVVAAENNAIPPAVLYAVASTESLVSLDQGPRPWPWTLNVAGESMRFGDRASACAALVDALKETRLVDVGIAQLNYRWQPQLFGEGQRFADPCAGLDPYANLDEAANLIRKHYEISGDWVMAAGRYHRPAGGKPAARYRDNVREVQIEELLLGSSSHGDSPMDESYESGRNTRPIGEVIPQMGGTAACRGKQIASNPGGRRLSGCVTALGVARRQRALLLPSTANV